MMHKAWSSVEEVPYCFSRSSVKFQGHTALKSFEFDPDWAFLDCNSSLNSPIAMKCCTKLETAKERCPFVFQGHSSNHKVTRDKTSPILTQIGRFRTIGRLQLSNPSDLPCSLYFHSWQYLVRGWLYRDIIFSLLTIFGQGVIISWHYIFTPGNIWSGGDYIVTLYFHSWQYLVRGWLYHDTLFSPLTIFGQGVIISWHHIFSPGNIWWGDDYIVTLYFHSWQYLVRGWLYRDIFSLLKIFGKGLLYRDITISFLTLP